MLRRQGNLLYHLHPPGLPASTAKFTYTFGLGGLALWFFVVLCFTGLLELLYYVPVPAEANASIKLISSVVGFGWLVRNVHYWAGQLMVVAAGLHLARVFLTGAANAQRRTNWLIGLGLLILTLFMDFSGYVLRWDEATHWALVAGSSLVGQIPLVGDTFCRWLLGASDVGGPALVRFYAWHVVGLPGVVLLLGGWHLWRIRRDGGISRPRPAPGTVTPMVSRDDLLRREAIVLIVATCALVLLSTATTVPIGRDAESSPLATEARAPWIFLGVQLLLRYWPPLVAGVLVPVGIVAILAALPFLEKGHAGIGRWLAPERQPWLWAFGIVTGLTVALWAVAFLVL